MLGVDLDGVVLGRVEVPGVVDSDLDVVSCFVVGFWHQDGVRELVVVVHLLERSVGVADVDVQFYCRSGHHRTYHWNHRLIV